ncbi:MAG: CHAT domain-containing protein, partial [Proteobacteria bacterium]
DTERSRKREILRSKRDQTERLQREKLISSEIQNQIQLKNSKPIPNKITVVFCASNPDSDNSLALDEEVRDIQNKIRLSDYRDSVELVSRWAMRTSDFMQAMNELRPHVVHFSGHGSEDGSIVFVSDDKQPHFVQIDAVVQMLKATSQNLRAVIFNACFSEGQAAAISKYVEVTIGMEREVGDDGARIFAAQFYSAVGFGKSIKNAFDQGIAALAANYPEEMDNPRIYAGEGIDLAATFLVAPGSTVISNIAIDRQIT